MGIVDKVKEAVSGAKPDHPHGLISDTWQQAVHRVGPKIAKAIWEAFPGEVKEKLAEGWVKELFQGVSLLIAQILPNKGVAQMIDALQVEVAAELHELASSYKKGHVDSRSVSAENKGNATSTSAFGAEGSHQILRLELERAQRIIAWLACAIAAELEYSDIVKFLDGLTLRELETFADLDDAGKQVYIEAALKKPLPKVQSEHLWKKIREWLGQRWEEAKGCAAKVNSDLEGIAIEIEAGNTLLSRQMQERDERVSRLEAWKVWKF